MLTFVKTAAAVGNCSRRRQLQLPLQLAPAAAVTGGSRSCSFQLQLADAAAAGICSRTRCDYAGGLPLRYMVVKLYALLLFVYGMR